MQQLIDQLVAKDPSSASLLQLGHSMVVIVQSTRVLKRCYESENYALIEKLKEIEEFLGMKKENLDFSSYQWYKKKHL